MKPPELCKYCRSRIKRVNVGIYLGDRDTQFKVVAPAKLCPVCDAPGALPGERSRA